MTIGSRSWKARANLADLQCFSEKRSLRGISAFSRPQAIILTFACLGSLSSTLLYPTVVWTDSYHYLSSAKSIFTSDFQAHYFWNREPGYPVLLKFLNGISNNQSVVISAVQGLILGTSAILPAYFIFLSQPKSLRVLNKSFIYISPIIFLTPQYFGYSSSLLKQTPIVLFAALSVSLINSSQRRQIRKTVFLVFTGTLISSFFSISAAWFWTSASIVAGFILASNAYQPQVAKVLDLVARLAFILGLFIISMTASWLGRSTWNSVRASVAPTSDLTLPSVSTSSVMTNLLQDPTDFFSTGIRRVFSLTMLGPTDGGGVKNNEIMSEVQLYAGKECGHFDFYEKPDELIEYTSYLKQSCRPKWGTSIARSFHPVGSISYKLTMVAIAIAFLLALRRHDNTVAFTIAIALLFLMFYSFGGQYTNDRYGLPLFPFGIMSLIYLKATARGERSI